VLSAEQKLTRHTVGDGSSRPPGDPEFSWSSSTDLRSGLVKGRYIPSLSPAKWTSESGLRTATLVFMSSSQWIQRDGDCVGGDYVWGNLSVWRVDINHLARYCFCYLSPVQPNGVKPLRGRRRLIACLLPYSRHASYAQHRATPLSHGHVTHSAGQPRRTETNRRRTREKNTVRASAIVCAHQLYLVINPQLHRRDHFTPSPPRHVTPINIAGFCHASPVISDGSRGRIHCLLTRWRRLWTGIRNVRLFDPTNLGGGRGAFWKVPVSISGHISCIFSAGRITNAVQNTAKRIQVDTVRSVMHGRY